MKKFNIHFKTDKVTELWITLSDKGFLCFDKVTNVRVRLKQKRNGKSIWSMPFKSRARLDCALNRMEDTLEYMNTIQLGSTVGKRSAFDFYDFVNCEMVVIDCIESIAKIFDMGSELKSLKQEKNIFNEAGTDVEFVKYIRSLASVHPLNTAWHTEFNGYENFHCSPRAYWDCSLVDDRDLTVAIYDSASSNDEYKFIGIKISDFVDYLNKWINFIDKILVVIKQYETDRMEQYRKIQMKSVSDFSSYPAYIAYLKSEYVERGQNMQIDCFKDYIRVFSISVSNPINLPKVELYRNAIKLSLQFLHQRLQNMEYGRERSTGIRYDEPTNYTELFIELHWPQNFLSNEHNIGYCIEKLVDESDFYRDRMEEIKGWVNQYVLFKNTESYDETFILVMTASYLDSLKKQNVLNMNIPNETMYRETILSREEYSKLISYKKVKMVSQEQKQVLKREDLPNLI